MKIELTEVVSSNIWKLGYDDDSQTLRVQFKSQVCWDYAPVPKEKYLAMVVAESEGRSVGKYFAREIRANKDYKATEVRPDLEETA